MSADDKSSQSNGSGRDESGYEDQSQSQQPHSTQISQSTLDRAKQNFREVQNRPAAMAEVKRSVALFALVGVGMGIAGYLIAGAFMSSIPSTSASQWGQVIGQIFGLIIQFIVIICIALIGSPVAALHGYTVGNRLDVESGIQYAATAIGAFVGNVVLMILGLGIITQQGALNSASSGGSGGGIGGMLGTIFIISIFVALVGTGSNYISQNFVPQPQGRHATTPTDD